MRWVFSLWLKPELSRFDVAAILAAFVAVAAGVRWTTVLAWLALAAAASFSIAFYLDDQAHSDERG